MITERARGLGRFRGGGVGAETAPASFQGHINTNPPPPPPPPPPPQLLET